MSKFARKVVLNSQGGYSADHDAILMEMIDDQVQLFCSVGKDCELWHDVMDELFVGDATIGRGYDMITTWHQQESLDETVEFARNFYLDDSDNDTVQVITV